MSGSKTRLGFSGGSEPPPSDPKGEISPRAARTMIGHEIHLRAPPDLRPAAGVPETPRQEALADEPGTPRQEALAGTPATPLGEARASVPETAIDEITEELPLRPSHTGKTKFPALARLFGRWTTGGSFLSRSRMSGIDGDLLNVPREAWVSRVAIFAVAGLLSFLVALAALKVHQCNTPAPPPSVTGQASVTPAPPLPPAAGATPAVLPEPPAPPGPAAAAVPPPAATVPVAPIAPPTVVAPKTNQRPVRRAAPSSTGKSRSQGTSPDPLNPPPGAANRDGLLPLTM
jgi:hypothetical protein